MYPDRQMTLISLALYALAFAVLFGVWVFLVKSPPEDKEQGRTMIQWIIAALGMLAGHVFTIVPGSRPQGSTPPAPQAGFVRLNFLFFVACAAIAVASVAGCTTTTGSMYAGVATQAKAGIQVFDDNSLATMHDLLCAQPYSAIQRHPELQPGIVALCGPLVNTASLDPAQVTQMLSIAKQLGITAVATPAAAPSGTK